MNDNDFVYLINNISLCNKDKVYKEMTNDCETRKNNRSLQKKKKLT